MKSDPLCMSSHSSEQPIDRWKKLIRQVAFEDSKIPKSHWFPIPGSKKSKKKYSAIRFTNFSQAPRPVR